MNNTENTNQNVTRYPVSEPVKVDLRHRYQYHAPKPTQAERYAEIREKVAELAIFISERVPSSREHATALTHLDAVMFYANAAIARNER